MHKNIATGGEIMKKRIISLLMALLMLTSLLPTAVWAEGEAPEQTAVPVINDGASGQEQEPAATPETPETPEAPEAPVEPEQPTEPEQSTEPKAAAEPEADAEPDSNGIALYSTASGQCGNNLTWTLDNGVLTISGKGAMWDRDNEWYGFGDVLSIDQADEVTSVVVKSGVTSIAYEAFNWLENMNSVTIPKTVTSIGCNAFMRDCDALTTINYAGTTSQWKSYFGSTLSLPLATKVVCSNGTVTPALSGKCGKNVSYSISDDGVLTISGTGAMNNFTYKSDISDCPWHGVRYALKKIVVEDGVTSIGSYAFSFDLSVTDVTLPSSLKTIGNDAFWGCYGLTSVVIPEGVTTIGAYAFEQCSAIKTITVPASATKFGDRAFITWEYYSDDDYHMALTDIYYGGSRQQWYDAGGGDAALTDVTVHFNGATGDTIDGGQCGANAFWKLDKTGTLTIYGSGAMYDYPIDDNRDSTSPWPVWDVKRIDVQEGITTIGAYAFCYTDNATALSLPDSLTSIGQDAFCGFAGTEIVVPDKVTSIGDFAFNTCNNLQTITLPAGLQNIGICFIECDALKTINFGGTMEQWLVCGGGESTFPVTAKVTCAKGGTLREGGKCGDNLTWTLDSSGTLTISGTGDMENYASGTSRGTDPAPWAYASSMIRSVEIGSGVTSIGSYALVDTNITSLTIPGSVTAIGDYGFNGNRYLAELTLQSGLKSIGESAFSWSKQLTTVTIPDGVTTIGEEAFAHCWAWLPKADTYVGLSTVSIPGSVTSIGKNAFDDNQELLATVNFDGTQEQWNAAGGKDSGMPDTATITFNNNNIVSSGNCDKLTWTLNNSGVLIISGNDAMPDCTETPPWWYLPVSQVVVCQGVTSIGALAFTSMKSITNVTIADSVTSIGQEAFERCTSLTSITLPASVTSIVCNAFYGCDELEYIYYGGTVAQWKDTVGTIVALPLYTEVICSDDYILQPLEGNCGDGVSYRISEDGTLTISGKGKMADYTYNNDSSDCPWQPVRYAIRKVVIENGVTHIGSDAFAYNINVTSIAIPGSVTSIGAGAFNGCEGLESAFIPGTVKEIGKGAFYCHENASLKTIYFSGTESQWNTLSQNIGLPDGVNIEYVKLGIITSDDAEPNVGDMQALYESLTGQKVLIYKQQMAADVNQDGEIDVYDLQRLYEAVNRINPL